MKKPVLVLTALALVAFPSASGATAALTDTPHGREDNALGTLRWLPTNANERPSDADIFRLVVIYDRSLNDADAPIPLKAKGGFGVKMFTTNQVDVKMTGHSPKVGDLNNLTGQNLPPEVNETVIGVYGDVRDGACSKLSTPGAFSQAYSTTRSFFHPGTTPYAPVSAAGTCETLDSSTEVRDADGNLVGFNTTATNHVPGFYVDLEWPSWTLPLFGAGRLLAEIWYGAAYDSAGDAGGFPQTADTTGASKSVGSPGGYTATISFTANPVGAGPSCIEYPVPDGPGSWADVKVQVPDNATKVTFQLFPKGDWDLVVLNPNGEKGISAGWIGMDETVVFPSPDIPELVPGEYTMRACNVSGEPTAFGAVTIETA